MNEDPKAEPTSGERPDDQESTPAPSGLFWPVKRLWWSFEKHFLWPVSDSFRRISGAMRYRSPLAYIGATILVCLTAGAVATAFYFYNEANQTKPAPVIAEAPLGSETAIAPVSPPPVVGNPSAGDDDSLQGVAPDFSTSGEASEGNDSSGKQGGGKANGNSSGKSGDKGSQKLPKTAVRPSELPDSPPLRVAYRFAETFVGYEVGEKKATRRMKRNSTVKLFRELAARPPRLPAAGRVPRASVMNVVAGKKKGRKMEASVALMRSGATSELRMDLTRERGKPWLVSEIRG